MGKTIQRRQILKAGLASCATAALAAGAAVQAEELPPAQTESSPDEPLWESSITHGGLQKVKHPRLGVEVIGQTAIRYLRFGTPVRIHRLELGRVLYGRWEPSVPCHPAHLVISVLDDTRTWKTVREVDLPADPCIWGEDLLQEMTGEEMNRHFERCMDSPAQSIDLGGMVTGHLRVVCDREHPTWPNHGECNGGPLNVPFGILNPLKAFGRTTSNSVEMAPYRPPLKLASFQPKSPEGMKVRDLPGMLLFESKWLTVGFSMKRPLLMHLGWDVLGEGQAANNRLFVSRRQDDLKLIGGLSGPILRTLATDIGAHLWTGEVSVEGNRVRYSNLHALEGISLDAVFTVEPRQLTVELTQSADHDVAVIEFEAWRFAWDLNAGITGAAALPTQLSGRNGDVSFPALWASDGVGCLSCSLMEQDKSTARLQVESYRFQNCVTGGFVLGAHPGQDKCQIIPAGARSAKFQLGVTSLEPEGPLAGADLPPSLRRHWGTVFSCFRPEYRGFSNHSASVNCHLSQGAPIEIAVHTRRPAEGPDPLDLSRFCIGKALLDGGGYGYHRNLYLDSDPVLVSAAGRIHQASPNLDWLRQIEPGLLETMDRLFSHVGEDGLLVCDALSGNSGSYRWSSNSMDVIGFGHIDAYVNAWSYRAFRNAAALLADLGQREKADRCRRAASELREAYPKRLLNPETGWVAGWLSRDGQLHDYAFTWVNGVAAAFGLLEPETARKALAALEAKRDEAGPGSARLGFPLNLLPIRKEDHMLPRIIPNRTQPTFETYTDGSLSGWPATYYLRALSVCGLKDRARSLAEEMAEGFAAGVFNGGNGAGHEFRSWEGLPTGYEGTLIGSFGGIYGIGIELGAIRPREPEWWPQNG
jgi:hypothetical protein